MISIIVQSFIFLFGLCVGSFLNVCIQRWPRDESILKPSRSHCPNCKAQIAWVDNIPLLSYLLLTARCRQCRKWISPRYFFVELMMGLLALGLWKSHGLGSQFFAGVIFLPILLSITMTDFETRYIPDQFTFFGMFAGLVLSAIFPSLHKESLWYLGLMKSGIGLLVGGLFLWAFGIAGNVLFKKESMGGGDIKLLAVIGAFLGWKPAILVFFFAPILSMPQSFFVLGVRLVKKIKGGPAPRESEEAGYIAFGPYLAAAAAGFFVYADRILEYISTTYGV